jgi:Photosynthesis affected mutant 68
MPTDMSTSPENKGNQAAEKLPFEPASNKSKTPKVAAPKVVAKPAAKTSSAAKKASAADTATVPEVVSRRMVRRMTFFSGFPTFLGMLTFLVSYFLVKQGGVNLPASAVLLVSLGFFGIGVLGLTYGILSTSWDEDAVGSLLGMEQFSLNFGRMRGSWKEARNQARGVEK